VAVVLSVSDRDAGGARDEASLEIAKASDTTGIDNGLIDRMANAGTVASVWDDPSDPPPTHGRTPQTALAGSGRPHGRTRQQGFSSAGHPVSRVAPVYMFIHSTQVRGNWPIVHTH
jgi:hypothetical protein